MASYTSTLNWHMWCILSCQISAWSVYTAIFTKFLYVCAAPVPTASSTWAKFSIRVDPWFRIMPNFTLSSIYCHQWGAKNCYETVIFNNIFMFRGSHTHLLSRLGPNVVWKSGPNVYYTKPNSPWSINTLHSQKPQIWPIFELLRGSCIHSNWSQPNMAC